MTKRKKKTYKRTPKQILRKRNASKPTNQKKSSKKKKEMTALSSPSSAYNDETFVSSHPLRSPFHPSKPNLVLDLDNTIISSVLLSKSSTTSSSRLSVFRYTDAIHIYRMYHRPYLQEFLDYIFSEFNVIVWTAASDEYAKFVIEQIIEPRMEYETKHVSKPRRSPSRIPVMVLTHTDCILSKSWFQSNTMKDLRLLYTRMPEWYSRENTLILDDMKNVKTVNRRNAILVKPFDVEKPKSERDTQLLKLMGKLYTMNERFHQNGSLFSSRRKDKPHQKGK